MWEGYATLKPSSVMIEFMHEPSVMFEAGKFLQLLQPAGYESNTIVALNGDLQVK